MQKAINERLTLIKLYDQYNICQVQVYRDRRLQDTTDKEKEKLEAKNVCHKLIRTHAKYLQSP